MSSQGFPTISVLTACLNAEKTIERTLKSIEAQQYPNLQYIVCDGGSTDGTLSILEKYKHLITKLISEKDKNIADAYNKGFRHATGDIWCWLNADDDFMPDALSLVAKTFIEHPEVDVVTGGCMRVFADGSTCITHVPERFYRLMALRNDIEQPSTFWKANIHRRAGQLDDTYYLALDWEWWNRLKSVGANFYVVSNILSIYYFTETNLTSKAGKRVIDEMHRITRTYSSESIASAYMFLFNQFDMKGYYDVTFRELSKEQKFKFKMALRVLYLIFGREKINSYNWNWASKQIRNVTWYK